MSVDAVLIAGPTASGKSAAALALAEHLSGLIVNADALQVYRELRLLSARPTPEDEASAPHRLYGHVGATERYSAGRYQEQAAASLAEARAAGRPAIFVGGTGLYFDVLTKGLSPIPAVPADIRQAVRRRFEDIGRTEFAAELARHDPAAAQLRSEDTQRLLRAMDVLQATGRPLSSWREIAGTPVLAGLKLARFVIAPPQPVLSERIGRRFEAMVETGALEEARHLMGLDATLPAAKAVGLRELWDHLQGRLPLDQAVARAQLATRQYAKRQMTWLRSRMKDWKWLDQPELSNLISLTRLESV
jgi:tRNA dimethylallyltransferase